MADLYLVRHGQTELNVRNILQGWHDSPLTVRGREQALATRAALRRAASPLTMRIRLRWVGHGVRQS